MRFIAGGPRVRLATDDGLHAGYPGIPPGAPDRPQAAVKGVRGIYSVSLEQLVNAES